MEDEEQHLGPDHHHGARVHRGADAFVWPAEKSTLPKQGCMCGAGPEWETAESWVLPWRNQPHAVPHKTVMCIRHSSEMPCSGSVDVELTAEAQLQMGRGSGACTVLSAHTEQDFLGEVGEEREGLSGADTRADTDGASLQSPVLSPRNLVWMGQAPENLEGGHIGQPRASHLIPVSLLSGRKTVPPSHSAGWPESQPQWACFSPACNSQL